MRIHSSNHPWLLLAILVVLLCFPGALSSKDEEKATSKNTKKEVTYDGTSLIINGKRELLYSGSIHYPRSTPDVNHS